MYVHIRPPSFPNKRLLAAGLPSFLLAPRRTSSPSSLAGPLMCSRGAMVAAKEEVMTAEPHFAFFPLPSSRSSPEGSGQLSQT